MFDRWITVLVSLLLIGAAAAAARGRTWGIALSLAAACWYPAAFAVGIAPPWFVFVGIAGMMPFIRLLPSLARFDKQATALLAAIAATLGTVGAVTWKHTAATVFSQVPLLRPSLYANHGLFLALAATVLFANRARLVGAWSESEVSSSGSRVRVADDALEKSGATVNEEEALYSDEELLGTTSPTQMRR
jgi:hypothetical protein